MHSSLLKTAPSKNYRITLPLYVLPDKARSLDLEILMVKDTSDNEREALLRHIAADDYFGTVATILDLISQDKKKYSKNSDKLVTFRKTIKELKDDLVYLQNNYQIIKKPNKKS